MKRTCARLALMLAAVLWTAATAAVEQGDEAPAWTANDLDGKEVRFPEVASGEPAVVFFWATWCPYCAVLMPHLEGIHNDYADKGVRIVAINAKERGRGNPREYLGALDFPMIAVLGGDGIADDWGVEFIPGLFVVDGAGSIAYRRAWTDLPAGQTVAELWDGQVREALDALLAAGSQ